MDSLPNVLPCLLAVSGIVKVGSLFQQRGCPLDGCSVFSGHDSCDLFISVVDHVRKGIKSPRKLQMRHNLGFSGSQS